MLCSANRSPSTKQAANTLGAAPILAPAAGSHSFHLRTDRRQLIQAVFQAYGIQMHPRSEHFCRPVRLDLDNATFAQAAQALSMVTESFWVPLDAHRVLVARDTRLNREEFLRRRWRPSICRG